MKTDMYTKVVLTVIALALTVNLFKGLITPAMAADSKPYAMVPVNADGTINVTVKKMPAETMDVKITDVSTTAFIGCDPIIVKVQE